MPHAAPTPPRRTLYSWQPASPGCSGSLGLRSGRLGVHLMPYEEPVASTLAALNATLNKPASANVGPQEFLRAGAYLGDCGFCLGAASLSGSEW